MSGDPTLGTWQPDVTFSDGIGGTFNQTPAYNPAMYGDGGRGAPQSLLDYPDSSYAQTRGWNPSPYAPNNSGPALGGGDWGGLMSDGGLYPDAGGGRGGNFSVGYDDPTGGASNGTLYPGGDYNDQFNAPYTNPFGDVNVGGQFQDPTGGAKNGSLYPGGDYNDSFNPQYVNPYGDLPAASTPGLLDGFQGSYERGSVPMPPPRPDYLPQPNPYGAHPLDVAPSDLYDQSYMDEPQGPYGSLMGGPDYDSQVTYERMDGSPLPGAPKPPQQEAYLFPTQPLMSPTAVYPDGGSTFSMPSERGSAAYFGAGITPMSPPPPAYAGGLDRNVTPMPGDPNSDKTTMRAPQSGGFVSYGPTGGGLLDQWSADRRGVE